MDDFDVSALKSALSLESIYEEIKITMVIEYQPTDTPVHKDEVIILESLEFILTRITHMVMEKARITGRFSKILPIVKSYLELRCYGCTVDLNDEKILRHLSLPEKKTKVVDYLASELGKAMLEVPKSLIKYSYFLLSDTKPFSWRRNLPPPKATKTIFNYVATYNDFERAFATFLDDAQDVPRFAALASTEQGESGTKFRIDYLKESGAIGFYYPDWVVIENTAAEEVNWIIETKGRIWEDTHIKDAAAIYWCERVSKATGKPWRYARVDQSEFEKGYKTLQALVSDDDILGK